MSECFGICYVALCYIGVVTYGLSDLSGEV